jgi:hypothetical protein
MSAMDIHQRDDLAFPQSLPEFQQLFPDDAACAAYLGRARWPDGFVCPHCGLIAEPFRIVTRPGVLECRACRRQAGLLVGTVMERSHTPLSVVLGRVPRRQPDAGDVGGAVSAATWADTI